MPPVRTCPAGYRQANVGVGDNYTSLLRRFNVSFAAMNIANPNVDPLRVIPGQPLCVPPSGTHTICHIARTATVQPGENLDVVARRLGATPAALLRANPLMTPNGFTPFQIICRP